MNLAAKMRAARTRRAIDRAISRAATPALRNELIVIAQSQSHRIR